MGRLTEGMGRALDGLIGVISPHAQAQRAQERARAMAFERYAAAKVDPRTGSAGLGALLDRDPNRLIGDKAPVLRARVRQLVRDFPIFARAVEASVNLVIGQGYMLQYQATRPDGGSDDETNKRVENAWWEWCQDCDACGEQDFAELERLARRQELEVGEALALMPIDRSVRQGVPLRLQMYEPDWLNGWGARPRGDNQIVQGLEIDPNTGKVQAYWFEDPLKVANSKRVEARDVVHAFQVRRPGQLRGVSDLTPAVLAARDIGEYVGAEVEGAMMAARLFAKRKVAAGSAAAQAAAAMAGKGDDRHPRLQELGYNVIEIMQPGEDLELFNSNRPGAQFAPTVNFIARLIAVCVNLSYDLVTGDYSGVNFSNLRGIRGDLMQQNRPTQRRLARQWHQRIFCRWLDLAHLGGVLALPSYWTRRAYYQACANWQFPGVEGADVLRETKSMLDKMRAGLISPQEVMAREGRDPDETLLQIQRFKKKAVSLGLDLDWSRTPIKNNPASLGASDDAGTA